MAPFTPHQTAPPRTPIAPTTQSPGGTEDVSAALLVVQSSDQDEVGNHVFITTTPFVVGRAAPSNLVLRGRFISRAHFSIDRDESGFLITQVGSTASTEVDGSVLPSAGTRLRDGARIDVPKTRLQFFCGTLGMQRFREELIRSDRLDAVTGLPTRTVAIGELSGDLRALRDSHAALPVIAVHVRGFDSLNDSFGADFGDAVLRHVSDLLRQAASSVDPVETLLVRGWGSGFFLIVRREEESAALAIVRWLGVALRQPMRWEGQDLVIPSGIGLTGAGASVDPKAALVSAEQLARLSGRTGSPFIRPIGEVTGMFHAPRPLDVLLRTLVGTSVRTTLIGFSCDKEVAPLIDNVSTVLSPAPGGRTKGIHIGFAEPRLVGVLKEDASREDVEYIIDTVRDAWSGAGATKVDASDLRWTTVEPGDLKRLGVNALSEIRRRLEAGQTLELPFPLAGPRFVGGRAPLSRIRFKILGDGFETAFRFVAAIALALVRSMKDAHAVRDEARKRIQSVKNPHPGLGVWKSVAFELAKLVDPTSCRAAAAVYKIRSLEGVKTLQDAVDCRNREAHSPGRQTDDYRDEERIMSSALNSLLACLEQLRETRLVSVDEIGDSDDEGLRDYQLSCWEGTSEFPSRLPYRSKTNLNRRWCYLLEADREPLALIPSLFVAECTKCQRHELVLADRPRTDAKESIEGRTVLRECRHSIDAKVQW